MVDIQQVALPSDALLQEHAVKPGCAADCFMTVVPGQVGLEDFIRAFFHSPVFRLERAILTILAAKPTNLADVEALARGESAEFAVWQLEQRSENQLMMAVYHGSRIRTWLMVAPADNGTKLFFGSAILARPDGTIGGGFKWSKTLHEAYSRILLRAARSRLL